MSASRRVRRFASLPSAERRIVCAALSTLPIAWLSVRWLPIGQIQLPTVSASRDRRVSPARVAALVAATAASMPFTCACLEQSIVTASLLRRRGFAASLVLGGDRVAARFDAHAWVEYDGSVVTDPDTAARYTPLWRVSS
jgi:hypothetical protein